MSTPHTSATPRLEFAGRCALYVSLTVLMTWPAVQLAGDHLIGIPRGDKYQFVWIFWWFEQAILELHQWPVTTPLQFHPTGVSLALHDMTWFWSLLSVPLQRVLDPRVVLNLFLLVSFPLNALAFHRLAREVIGGRYGPLVGGFVFAFCPYFLGRFYVSHVQYLGAFFIPLFVLALWRYWHSREPRQLWLAGLWLSLQSLITFYYGVALVYLTLGFAVACARRERQRPASERRPARLAAHFAAMAAITGLLLAPFVAPMVEQLISAPAAAESAWARGENISFNSADAMAYLVPDHSMASWRGWSLADAAQSLRRNLGDRLHGSFFERSVYPGYVGWLALLLVLASPELRRRLRPWWALMLGFVVFGLGPSLHVGGKTLIDGWMPGAIAGALPGLDLIRSATRYSAFAMLGAGMLVAGVIRWLEDERGQRTAGLVAAATLVLSLAEFLPRPVTAVPFDRWLSPVNLTIRDDPRDVAVLDVPVDFRDPRGGADLYEYAQTIHGKPMVGGYVSREPDRVLAPLRQSAFLRAVEQREYESDPRLILGDEGLADLDTTLDRLRVGYVLVHRSLLPGTEWNRVNAWLSRRLGQPFAEDRWLRAYRYPADPAPR